MKLSVPFRQLILIIELYSHYDVYDYLRQIALTLCSDKVSEVRWISYKLVSQILTRYIRRLGFDDLIRSGAGRSYSICHVVVIGQTSFWPELSPKVSTPNISQCSKA